MSELDAARLRAEIERMRTFTLGTDFTPVVEKDEVIRIVDRLTVTHGRHCPCSACAREDWTNPDLAHCGMHGPSCPRVYAPRGLSA